jgi:hypothetical protein
VRNAWWVSPGFYVYWSAALKRLVKRRAKVGPLP